MNPRPADMGDRSELWFAAYNASAEPVTTTLAVTPPAGCAFSGPPVLRRGSDEAGNPKLSEAPLPADGRVVVPAFDAVVVVVPLDKAPAPGVQARRLSAFSPVVAVRATIEVPYAAAIACPPDLLALAKRPGATAVVRLATGNIAAGEASLSIGGQTIPVPAVVGSDNGCWLTEIAIPATAIAADMPVKLTIVDPARTAGVTIAAVSVTVAADL